MAKKTQDRAAQPTQAPQAPSTAKRILSALGGLLLSQVTGAVAAQASTKWGGLFSTLASGTIGGVGAAVANNYGNQYALDAGSGMLGGAVLNGLKALLGLSKNNMLRDIGSLERAVQTSPNAPTTTNAANTANTTGTTPTALPSGSASSSQSATTPAQSNNTNATPSAQTAAAPAKKTLEVIAYVQGETIRFKTPGGYVQENVIEIQEDGWIAVKNDNEISLLIDKERMGWKAADGQVDAKGHAARNFEFASEEEKKAGTNRLFYFYDDSQEDVSGFVELDNSIDGLVDLDGEMGGLVDLDGSEVGGLVDLNDDPLDGYASPYYDDEDDEEYEDD